MRKLDRRPKKAKAKSRATARKAITFGGVKGRFTWTNDEWAQKFLPPVRVATILLNENDRGLETKMAGLVDKKLAPEVLESWVGARDHFKALVETLDVALVRSFVVLERMGYSPENPPLDR